MFVFRCPILEVWLSDIKYQMSKTEYQSFPFSQASKLAKSSANDEKSHIVKAKSSVKPKNGIKSGIKSIGEIKYNNTAMIFTILPQGIILYSPDT